MAVSFRRKVLYFVYQTFFRHTPESYQPYALFFPHLRRSLVSQFVVSAGDIDLTLVDEREELGVRTAEDRSGLGRVVAVGLRRVI